MPTIPVQQALTLAWQHHLAGRFTVAEALYRSILAAQPDHFTALHRFSLLAERAGHRELAVELVRRAIAFPPRVPESDPARQTGTFGHTYRTAGELLISVAHPTCRPDLALSIRQLWLQRASQPERIEYIFGINACDAKTLEKLALYPHARSAPVPPGYSSAVANYNAAVAATHGKLIICAQDDIYPPAGWDQLIWERMKPHLGEAKTLHVYDGFNQHQLMVVMCFTRPWLETNGGSVLSPEYDGYFSDNEYSLRAYAAGQVIDGRDILFFHDHPYFTGRGSDEAYLRQQNPEAVARGRAIFYRRNPARSV